MHVPRVDLLTTPLGGATVATRRKRERELNAGALKLGVGADRPFRRVRRRRITVAPRGKKVFILGLPHEPPIKPHASVDQPQNDPLLMELDFASSARADSR